MLTKSLLLPLFATAVVVHSGFGQPIIVRTSTILDGKGRILTNQQLTIENGKITKIGPNKDKPTIDLSGLTVSPGWIDTHVHATWYFNKEGRYETGPGRGSKTTAAEAAQYAADNMRVTLLGGFTTVQSPGAMQDKDLRAKIASGEIPGPRLLTSLGQLNERSGTPDEIRKKVDDFKARGADLIKLFATASIRDGGKMTASVEQINATCDEAKKQGLRTIVHAHASDGAAAAINAGCTSIEHGTFLDDATLELMKQKGTYFDPNFLVLHNYLDNKAKFLGIGNYNEEGFAYMEKGLPEVAAALKRGRRHNVKVIFGTDGVAGAHGRNAEEFVYRVRDGGDKPMDALVSATSMSAESLGLGNQIGTVAEGMEADIVATQGSLLDDITNVRRVMFVMKHGKVYKEGGKAK
jgi:imidazolonepropionase-like amidohydrolase